MIPRHAVRRIGLRVWLASMIASVFMYGCAPAPLPFTPTPIPPTATPTATIPYPTAVPTQTSTPLPPSTATPDLHQSLGPLVFSSDFESSDGWPLSQDASGATSVSGGQLAIVVSAPQTPRMAISPSPIVADFYLDVSAHAAICSGEDEYGIVFRVNPNGSRYQFTVTCSGGIRLRRYVSGSGRAIVPFEDKTLAVLAGAPADNQLAVLAQGRDLHLYVNGYEVLDVQDATFNAGQVGLIVASAKSGQTTITFDNFKVWTLRAGDQASPTPSGTPHG